MFTAFPFAIVLLLWCLHFGNSANYDRAKSNNIDPSDDDRESTDNLRFDVPAISIIHQQHGGNVTLEAFKVKNSAVSKWVSFGAPYIVRGSEDQIFYFTDEDVTVYMGTMDGSQVEALLKAAKSQYPNVSISADSIIRFTNVRFSCEIQFKIDKIFYKIRGYASDVGNNLFKLKFHREEGSKKQVAFEERIRKNAASLDFQCDLVAKGKQEKANVLKINAKQLQDLNVADRLMGPASETYVVRQQLATLSKEVKSRLEIDETYELDNEDFTEEFIQKMLSKLSFEAIPIDEALSKLSKYGTSMDQRDLSPNVIKRQLENKFEIKTDGSKKHIVAKKDHKERNKSKDDVKVDWKAKADIAGLVSAESQINVAVNKERDWSKDTSTLDDQLEEINKHGENGLQWEIEGDRVIPKSLNVAKVSRMTINEEITFSRIKKRLFSAKYAKRFEIMGHSFRNGCNCTEATSGSATPWTRMTNDEYFSRVATACSTSVREVPIEPTVNLKIEVGNYDQTAIIVCQAENSLKP